jgi:hypothetical protein
MILKGRPPTRCSSDCGHRRNQYEKYSRNDVQASEAVLPASFSGFTTSPFPVRPAWSNPLPVMTARALLAILLMSSLLAACGVRGKPEAPEGGHSNKNDPVILDPLIK